MDGVAYNLPGKAQVTLMYNNKKLFDDQLPITQFGTVEYLAPVLFNKNSTIKVLFDTATGGLIKWIGNKGILIPDCQLDKSILTQLHYVGGDPGI